MAASTACRSSPRRSSSRPSSRPTAGAIGPQNPMAPPTTKSAPSKEIRNLYPPEELKLRRELGLAMLEFSEKLKETAGPHGMKDDVLRRVATEKFRRAVENAASH